MEEPKVVITGPGRSGTTLLVQVLTKLGLDTGEAEGNLTAVHERTRGGLESSVEAAGAARIVKDTAYFPFRFRAIMEEGVIPIGHVIVPMRALDVAAASRVRASNYGRNPFVAGGLWGRTRLNPMRQSQALSSLFYDLMLVAASFEVPHTLLAFPRFTTDWEYTHRRLSFLAPDRSAEDFRAALEAVVDPDLIHESALTRRETRAARTQAVRLRYLVAKQGLRGRFGRNQHK